MGASITAEQMPTVAALLQLQLGYRHCDGPLAKTEPLFTADLAAHRIGNFKAA